MADAGFDGLRIAAFESRMAGPMADMIARKGGVAVEAPSLKEVPIEENREALAFADSLAAGRFDVIHFETGVGSRYLAQAIEPAVAKDRFLDLLRGAKVTVRGPKPASVMREWGVPFVFQSAEPNTWHETLAAFDEKLPVSGLRVAVQEYGKPSTELVEGLKGRGAEVTRVPVYRWALPDDTAPLRAAIREIVEGSIHAVMFTSAQQIVHVLQVADELGLGDSIRSALDTKVIVASVGPTTTGTLKEHGLPVDIEPDHPKMGHLVNALASGWRATGKVEAGRIDSSDA